MTTVNSAHDGGDHASRPAATAVTAGSLYSCTDHDLIYRSDGATWSTWADLSGGGGGATGVPGWVSYLAERQPGETAHADDDFYDDDDDSVWGTTTVDGSATWTEQYGVLSAVVQLQTAGNLAARTKAITSPTAPWTIEAGVEMFNRDIDSGEVSLIAIGFASGTAAGATSCIAGIDLRHAASATSFGFIYGGTLTSYAGGNTNFFPMNATGHPYGIIHVRLVWVTTNTFRAEWSIDAVSWHNHGTGNIAVAFNPTHYVLAGAVPEGEAAETGHLKFHYLRAYEEDR